MTNTLATDTEQIKALFDRVMAIKVSPFKFDWSADYASVRREIEQLWYGRSGAVRILPAEFMANLVAQVARAEKPAKKRKATPVRRGYAMPDSDCMENFDADF